ncbi:MAG: hypothetical protein PT119_08010 [Aphanizomenon gracile PMC627.10]|jgi:hypothetical protein|nr:hypothetical protein [Aphanizomenon gracile PMC638.10]MDM3849915.1 hypothetical protein [Aphanizomenon gracile PMC627.10]
MVFREHQKINYPILWDGHPARPNTVRLRLKHCYIVGWVVRVTVAIGTFTKCGDSLRGDVGAIAITQQNPW